MPVRTFLREKFLHTHENRAFNQVADLLQQAWGGEDQELVILLGNYYCNGVEIDATLISRRSIIVIDFKDYGGTVTFSENDSWIADDVVIRGGGTRNPFLQIQRNRFALMNYLSDEAIFDSTCLCNLGHISGLVVFSQPIFFNPSQIPGRIRSYFDITDVGGFLRKVHDEISSREIDLSQEQRLAIVEALDLEKYEYTPHPTVLGRQDALVELTSPADARTHYTAEISRDHPACLLFLIDQSGSMERPMGGSDEAKAEVVARAINRLLREITMRCSKEDGIRDYFDVGVIGYSGHSARPALGGALAGRLLVPISDIADNPLRVDEMVTQESDGAGGFYPKQVRYPVWFDPQAEGETPMCHAFDLALEALRSWIADHPHSFPPVVMNITDGVATDGDATQVARSLRELRTADGQVLLFNMHVSQIGSGPGCLFPSTDIGLPGTFAKRLFSMSSVLPNPMCQAASAMGIGVDLGSRGFAYNADMTTVIQFLDIGTQATQMVS